MFQCAYPLLTGKPAKIAGSLLTAALKYVKFDTGAITAENVFGFSADVYVFDDLERYEGVKNTNAKAVLHPAFARTAFAGSPSFVSTSSQDGGYRAAARGEIAALKIVADEFLAHGACAV